MNNTVKDSGNRRVFDTGAQRDMAAGKGAFHLLPFFALERVALRFEGGSVKYGDHNWRKGIPTSSFVNSAIRHIIKHVMGFRDEDHLAAAAFNVLCLMETETMIEMGILPPKLNDLYRFINLSEDTPDDTIEG